MAADDRIYIIDMALYLDRAEHTIRQWLKRSDFPEDLKPEREGGRNKIFWRRDQVEKLQAYADEREEQRGSWGRATA